MTALSPLLMIQNEQVIVSARESETGGQAKLVNPKNLLSQRQIVARLVQLDPAESARHRMHPAPRRKTREGRIAQAYPIDKPRSVPAMREGLGQDVCRRVELSIGSHE